MNLTNKPMRSGGVISAMILALTSLPVVVYAADREIEEIIVSARQKDETLQDVPVTVSAFSGEDMARYNVQNLADVSNLVPAFNIYQGGSGNGSNLFLRGIGSSSISAAFDHSVAVALDGVVANTGRIIANAYLDMGQVEVLKGPQALYFGKSATAGVLSVTTNDPGDELEVIASAGYESETEATYAELILSGPITDTFGARLALGVMDTDKLFENTSPFAAAQDLTEESENLRLTLLWDPADNLQMRFKLNDSNYQNDGPGSITERRCVDGTAQDNSGAFVGRSPTLHEDCEVNGTTSRADAWAPSYVGVPGGNGGVPYLDQDLLLASLEINWQFSDTLELTSVTGWLDQETNDVGQYCYCSPSDPATQGTPTEALGYFASWSQNIYEGFTQEFRLASDFDGSFNFMAGFFYEDAHQEFNTDQYAVNITRLLGPDPITGIGSDWRKDHTLDSETYSIFLAGYWELSDTIEVTAGARYTDVEREGKIDIVSMHLFGELLLGFLPAGSQIGPLEFEDDNISPELAVTWHASDEYTFYAAYKAGYKPGGVDNSVLPSASLDPNAESYDFIIYESEEADGFEVGMKALLLDGSLRLNATIFNYVYEDLQVQQFDSQAIQFNTLNAGELTTRGLEFDALWYPDVEGLSFRAAWAFTDTEYTDDFFIGDNNLDGEKREYVPDLAGNVGVTWEVPLNDNWMMSFSADARYSDDYVTDYPNCDAGVGGAVGCQDVSTIWSPGFAWKQDSFWMYDASVRLISDRWEIALSGVNLDDERIVFSEGAIPGTQPDYSGNATALEDNGRGVNQGRKITLRATFRL
ncbi:MAG: TonB-dependent receptor [Gammaproteobacteria bacterium]|jgi:iron complex outermembrane receptor protein|nr:TonB-dependent receptor [Gammaproteobacteria bacterium]